MDPPRIFRVLRRFREYLICRLDLLDTFRVLLFFRRERERERGRERERERERERRSYDNADEEE